jgi:L-rhamnose-H+ transport protein
MRMTLIIAIILAAFAGFLNGSYTVPIKYARRWHMENNWLVFSLFSFLLTPWLMMYILDHRIFHLVGLLGRGTFYSLVIGGFILGIGMVMFAFSLRYLGIGISFLLSIAVNTVMATLVPLLFLIFTDMFVNFGLLQIGALGFFILAIIASLFVIKFRHRRLADTSSGYNKMGAIIGIVSGTCTAAQGIFYTLTILPTRDALLPITSSWVANNIPWLILFTAGFIPYAAYFLILSIKNKTVHLFFQAQNAVYYLMWFMVSLYYFLALVLFSQSSFLLGDLGSFIAWPLFMIFIVIASNFWGYVQGEWKNACVKEISTGIISIAFLFIAIGFLAFNAKIHLLS